MRTRRLFYLIDSIIRFYDYCNEWEPESTTDCEDEAREQLECFRGVSDYNKGRIAEYFGISGFEDRREEVECFGFITSGYPDRRIL